MKTEQRYQWPKPSLIQLIKSTSKNLYYKVKFFFFPYNVLKLNKLDRGTYDTATLMEESIFHLLEKFFHGEQPFHLRSGNSYEKSPTVHRHWKLLTDLYDGEYETEEYLLWKQLLEILEWYHYRKFDQEQKQINDDFMSGRINFEELNRLEQLLQTNITKKAMFVFDNRDFLWT